MKIVIDIDDNLYTRLFDNGMDNYDDAVDIAKAIRKGTPQESVLDKIRAEIEELPTTLIDIQRPNSVVERDVIEVGSVLRILDKYKVESEG